MLYNNLNANPYYKIEIQVYLNLPYKSYLITIYY